MTCKDHQYRQKSNIRQILVQVQEDTQSFIVFIGTVSSCAVRHISTCLWAKRCACATWNDVEQCFRM